MEHLDLLWRGLVCFLKSKARSEKELPPVKWYIRRLPGVRQRNDNFTEQRANGHVTEHVHAKS